MTDTTTRQTAPAPVTDEDEATTPRADAPTSADVTTRADATASPPAADPAASDSDKGPSATTIAARPGTGEAALFDETSAKDLQGRWQTIQVGFVDEPRGAVEQADKLVDEVLTKLQESFARERQDLEGAWSGGNEASTEDLRQAIRRYRSFFNRLLAI